MILFPSEMLPRPTAARFAVCSPRLMSAAHRSMANCRMSSSSSMVFLVMASSHRLSVDGGLSYRIASALLIKGIRHNPFPSEISWHDLDSGPWYRGPLGPAHGGIASSDKDYTAHSDHRIFSRHHRRECMSSVLRSHCR